ncbi:MAG: hypothetical protein AB1758_34040 [Candidatus Eremiobacterota bacterium]
MLLGSLRFDRPQSAARAELYVSSGQGWQRMDKRTLGLGDLACEQGPYLQEYRDGAVHVTAPRAQGAPHFDTALPEREVYREMLDRPGRLLVRTDRALLSLDAETGEVRGRLEYPNLYGRRVFPASSPDRCALLAERELVLLDSDLNELARHPLRESFDHALELPDGGWLLRSRSQGRATVLGPTGFPRTSCSALIPDSDQVGPDGRVWWMESTSEGVQVVACGPDIRRFPLEEPARVLVPRPDGSFYTVTDALKDPVVMLHDRDGGPVARTSLGPGRLEALQVAGDHTLAVVGQRVLTLEDGAAREVFSGAQPLRAALLASGRVLVAGASGAVCGSELYQDGADVRARLGEPLAAEVSGWGRVPSDLGGFLADAEVQVGFPDPGGSSRPGAGRDGTWTFQGVPCDPPPREPERQLEVRHLFEPSREGGSGLYPGRPDLTLVVEKEAVIIKRTGRPGFLSHSKVEEPVVSAAPILFGETPGYLAATASGMLYYDDGESGRCTFDLDAPLARLTVHPDRLVAEGTNGNVLVIHPEAPDPALAPEDVSPRPEATEEPATRIRETEQGVQVGGVWLRRKRP